MSRNGIIVDIETCHKDAEIPEYQNRGDAGMDLKAVSVKKNTIEHLWFKTGIKVAIPKGYVGLIFPRSSITEKKVELGNSVGVIDSGFRGEIQVRFNRTAVTKPGYAGDYTVGDRVAQLMIIPYPHIYWNPTDDIEDVGLNRDGGFGSTGDR